MDICQPSSSAALAALAVSCARTHAPTNAATVNTFSFLIIIAVKPRISDFRLQTLDFGLVSYDRRPAALIIPPPQLHGFRILENVAVGGVAVKFAADSPRNVAQMQHFYALFSFFHWGI